MHKSHHLLYKDEVEHVYAFFLQVNQQTNNYEQYQANLLNAYYISVEHNSSHV